MNSLKTTLAFVATLDSEVSFQADSSFYLAHQGQSWPWGSQIAD